MILEIDRLIEAVRERYGIKTYVIIRSESEVYISEDTQEDWHIPFWHGTLQELRDQFLTVKAGA